MTYRGLLMRNSRPLQVLLLLVLGVTVVDAGEPAGAVFGAGAGVTCKAYVNMLKDPRLQVSAFEVVAWVQGFFSARNIAGVAQHNVLTVGGTLSPQTLRWMLADQCADEKLLPEPVVLAASQLYFKLQAKGL